jgi:hypothetical protein
MCDPQYRNFEKCEEGNFYVYDEIDDHYKLLSFGAITLTLVPENQNQEGASLVVIHARKLTNPFLKWVICSHHTL